MSQHLRFTPIQDIYMRIEGNEKKEDSNGSKKEILFNLSTTFKLLKGFFFFN